MQGPSLLGVSTGDIAYLWIIIYGDVNSQVTCNDPWVLHWTVKDTSEEWSQVKDIWNLKMQHNTDVWHLEFYLVHIQFINLKQNILLKITNFLYTLVTSDLFQNIHVHTYM